MVAVLLVSSTTGVVRAEQVQMVAQADATVYDLAPTDGSPDMIMSWQAGLEAGVAYDYYRDGRVARALLLFDLSGLKGRQVLDARFLVTVWSFRMASSFDVIAYSAGELPDITDWGKSAYFVARSGDVSGYPARVPFEFDVTPYLEMALAQHWDKLGIRLEDGGSAVTDPHVGFIGLRWQPDPNIIYPMTYPHLDVQVRVSGDVDGDDHVDVVDLLWLVDAFGSVTGDANYDARCDFNGDGAVDVADLLDLVYNFGA
jgi:hypothetical protein